MKLSKKEVSALPCIHEGPDSLIYRQDNSEFETPVIIKLLKHDNPISEQISRFDNEYMLTKDLDIPGIRKAYQKLEIDNRPALVLSYIEGETLKNAFFPHPGHLEEILSIAVSVAQALGDIHSRGIIHKDINSSNIIVNLKEHKAVIIDFGIASQTSQTLMASPARLEGTLYYISPEQTGRISRNVDYRTDLYSLGVTLYEMLAGKLPFPCTDTAELIHSHIAKTPEPVCAANPDVPEIVSDMVLKLMEKNPENRYQSAYGLKADLEKALNQMQRTGSVSRFDLASDDFSGKLQIPQMLCSREEELRNLMKAFEWVRKGTGETLLVSGHAGTGKTFLVNKIQNSVTEKGGYFVAGEQDQYQQNIPFFGLIQALNGFVGSILTRSEAELANWKAILTEAAGDNGYLLTEVIPSLELIIGKQQPVSQSDPAEARNRFQYVFQNVIRTIAANDHPLVLFIDNLQWADAASLNFIRLLMTDAATRYLLFIGAYRDNEVGESHPLMTTVKAIQLEKGVVSRIVLENLSRDALDIFVPDMLRCKPHEIRQLTDIIHEKTGGNPLFVTEYVTSVFKQGLLRFDTGMRTWKWDGDRIREKSVPDTVAALMIHRIGQLPEDAREMLMLSACIGNTFDLKTLAEISGQAEETIACSIRKAADDGLVKPLDKSRFEFVHSRIREASYALIPKKRKKTVSLAIGRLRLADMENQGELEEHIFDIADRFNEGFQYIKDKKEMLRLAELNLIAGRKAKKATAYPTAIWYFSMGIGLLPPKFKWDDHYDLTLSLYTESLEAEYLSSNYERAKQLSEEVLLHADDILEKVKVYQLSILFYTAQNQNNAAIKAAMEAMELLGIFLEAEPGKLKDYIRESAESLKEKIRQIDDLAKLPLMDNAFQIAAMRIMMNAAGPAHLENPLLLSAIVLTMVSLSVEHGNSPLSAFAYGWYGVLLCHIYGQIETGYQFGQLSVKLSEQFNAPEIRAKVSFLFNTFINPFKAHIRESVKPLKAAIRIGIESGDLEYAYYSAIHRLGYQVCMGKSLDLVYQDQITHLETMEKYRLEFHRNFGKIWAQTVLNLRGGSADPCRLSGELTKESEMLQVRTEQNNPVLVFSVFCCKTMLQYIFKNFADAAESGRQGMEYAKGGEGFFYLPVHYFYYALALLARCSEADAETRNILINQAAVIQKKMVQWASHCPMNFQHKSDLIGAEMARLSDDALKAMELYGRAVLGAGTNGFIQEEALAYEREAEFYLTRGREDIAMLCMTKARDCYRRWGATRKVEDMEKHSGHLLTAAFADTRPQPAVSVTGSASISAASAILDTAAVIKASHNLSREVHLDKLLEIMIRIVIENAGAEKGILIENRNNNLIIQAKGRTGDKQIQTMQAEPAEKAEDIPLSVIHYVARTLTPVVLHNASEDRTFASDTYIRSAKLKSLLCLPIVHQDKLTGILYLENNLTPGAFTSDRLELLNVLSSQAAISMENASLYASLEDKVAERTRQLNEAMNALWGEMELAKKIQSCLLPEKPVIDGYEIAASCEPADEVGGDYYDVISVAGFDWIVIGDVSGHGVTAGLVMMMVQTAIHTMLIGNPEVPPSNLLSVINRTIYENIVKMDEQKHMTILVIACGKDGFFHFSGLHEDILLRSADTRKVEKITADGMWIGLESDISNMLPVQEFRMGSGDCIVLYTDGITEAIGRDGNFFGTDRLAAIIHASGGKSAAEIHADIMEALKSYEKPDDITLFVMKKCSS